MWDGVQYFFNVRIHLRNVRQNIFKVISAVRAFKGIHHGFTSGVVHKPQLSHFNATTPTGIVLMIVHRKINGSK